MAGMADDDEDDDKLNELGYMAGLNKQLWKRERFMKILKVSTAFVICLFFISCEQDTRPKTQTTQTQPTANEGIPEKPKPQTDTGEAALAELCRGAIAEQ